MEPLDGRAGPLTDVSALARALAGPAPPVLLDVRWRLGVPPGIEAYRAGHLPRSVFVDLDADLAEEPGPAGRHPLPTAERFQAAMRRAGVSTGSTTARSLTAGTGPGRPWVGRWPPGIARRRAAGTSSRGRGTCRCSTRTP